ncbi:peptide ABC transporter substrate-binding protein [Fimbriimonas ginsengisoli]|nr:peptide ABC transporter substrate-binding protein [Fimbriimonas ginsengisoli]
MKWTPVLFLAVVLGLAGCTGGKFSEKSSEGKANILRYPIPEFTKLDPAMVQDGDSIDVIQQVYEGLVKWGEDSKVTPNLAEKWDVSKDGMTYTFHLRKGITFSNGRAVTADDFKYSFERAADPKLASPTTSTYLAAIVGIQDKLNGKASEVAGVKVVDPSTLQIVIDKPRPYFIDDLTYPAAWVVCKESLKDGGEIQQVDQMVGTGPFIAKEFVPTVKITLVANKKYWDTEHSPKLEGIDRPIVKDAVTRLNMFRSGEVDLTRIERQDLVGINNDPKLKDDVKFFDRPSLYYVGLNCQTYKPFTDVRVRRAFAMAIDADDIVKTTLGGVNKVARSILPPSVLGYREKANYIPFDVAKAKQLLAEAGYAGGKGMPPLVLTHRDGQPDVKLVAERVVTMLRQNLGVEATTSMLPWNTYLDVHNKHKLDFFHMRWAADYLDPENFLSTLLASYGNENKINYKNPAFDALCRQGDSFVGEESQRLALYAQAEDMVLQDAPFIPIYFERAAELISPRVKGLRESVFGHLPHTTTRLE